MRTMVRRRAAASALGLGIGLGVLALLGPTVASADFVCPVIPVSDQGAAHSNANFITISGGDTSILPGKAGDPALSPVAVPAQATNGDGAGSPGGAHSVPGDSDYSAIWDTP